MGFVWFLSCFVSVLVPGSWHPMKRDLSKTDHWIMEMPQPRGHTLPPGSFLFMAWWRHVEPTWSPINWSVQPENMWVGELLHCDNADWQSETMCRRTVVPSNWWFIEHWQGTPLQGVFWVMKPFWVLLVLFQMPRIEKKQPTERKTKQRCETHWCRTCHDCGTMKCQKGWRCMVDMYRYVI